MTRIKKAGLLYVISDLVVFLKCSVRPWGTANMGSNERELGSRKLFV